ncbi:GDP-fucose protein O-fucosyltransferase 1-like [Gigantopelta aegis]|uniref:GDP-fucose protein O-fucosyltransferase 1-like n=1 Tax=Gigantopelta aegis TaxID=1735272 RepID=UPI001B8884A8|nr:GDP-fucose protein O-fucosyltransferase 1-like [Gigantopelta aegis]
MILFICVLLYLLTSTLTSKPAAGRLQWDPSGYVIFCPCMGRFGNQADHFLGALSFAKKINRTLVLPPWRTYKNVPFNDWFKTEPLKKFHRVVLAEDFMAKLAPIHWPPGRRSGWCWLPSNDKDRKCAMKEGNPFGPFWDGLKVDFDDYVIYNIGYSDTNTWQKVYPPAKYPVMAFKGAPASFPVQEEDVALHRFLEWSDTVEDEALGYINKHFPGDVFVGIHLRNGPDWANACEHVGEVHSYMSSPQCLGYSGEVIVTGKLCFPPKDEILRLLKNVVISTKAKVVYVATDKDPMIDEIKEHLKKQKVKVFHQDPWLPQIDLAILGMSDQFIGNCVSSFTAFVARERKAKNLPTSFWAYS